MESLLTKVESLAPRFASGDVASLDPLAEALANLLARSRERDWLTEESESLMVSSSGRSNGSTGAVGSRIAITRLVAVMPELSRHCPELHGIFHPADVADAGVAQPSDPANGAPFGAANDGPHGLSTDLPSSSVWAVHALRPLLQALRVVRNLLAGSAANQDAFLRCGAVDLVATIADRLILSRDMFAAPALRATKAHIRGDGRSREDGGDSQGKGIMGGSVGGEAKAGGNVSKSDVTKLKEMGSVSSLSDALASLIAEVGGSAGRLGETENRATSPEAAAATSATAAAATSAATDMSGASPATAPKVAAAAVAEAAEGKQPSADGQLNSVHPGIPPSLSTSPPLPLPPHIGPSPFPHPTSLSTFTPTAAPSGPRFPHSVPLPVNHLDTLKTVLQLLGNFCGGGRKQQQAVWDRCFPGTFSRIAAACGAAGRAAGVRSAMCMVLFTCVRTNQKAAADLGGSAEGIGVVGRILRGEMGKWRKRGRRGDGDGDGGREVEEEEEGVELGEWEEREEEWAWLVPNPHDHDAPATSLDPWLSLLLERLCLRGSFFNPLFAGLSRECGAGGKEEEREEEGEKGGAASLSLKQLDEGRFRWEQAGLLWGVWGALAAVAEAQGVSAGVGGGAKGESEEKEEKGGKVAKEGKGAEQKKREQGESFPLVGPGSLNFLLTVCRDSARAVARVQAQGMLLAPSYQVGHASHMPSNEVPHNEATSARHTLRFSLHCLRILAALDPVPAAEPAPLGSGVAGSASTDLLSAVGGSDLIPLLLDLLHGLGPPAIASAAATATRETTATGTAAASNAPHKAPGSIRNPEIGAAAAATFPPGPTALYPWCNPYPGYRRDVVAVIANAGHERKAYQDAVRCYTAPSIPVSAAASGAIAAAPGGAVGGGGAAAAAAAAAADDDDDDDNSATATDATKDSSSNPHPTGNPTPAITPSSNIMSSGLFLVLQQCVTGDSTQGDDLLREWGLWAVRNLLEANPENAADVAALEVRGGAQTEGLREMGLAVEVDERSGRPKLRNIGADER
ncbi:unnamed protein product [Closterium sp. NIES-54]